MENQEAKQKSVLWPILKLFLIFTIIIAVIVVGFILVANIKLSSIGLGGAAEQFGLPADIKIKDIFESLKVLNADPDDVQKEVVQQIIPETTAQVEEKLAGSSFQSQPGTTEERIQELLEPDKPVVYPVAKTVQYTDAELAAVIRAALAQTNFSLQKPPAPGAILTGHVQPTANGVPSVSDVKIEVLEVSFQGSTIAGNAVCRIVISADISSILPMLDDSLPAALRSFVNVSSKFIIELLIGVEKSGDKLILKNGVPLKLTINNSPETTSMLTTIISGLLDIGQLTEFLKTTYGQKVCNLVNNLGLFVSIENGIISLTTRTA